MRQQLPALLLSIVICAVCVQPLQARHSEATPAKAALANQCRPSLLGVLASIGWAYATKSYTSVSRPNPCPDDPQEKQQNAQAQESKLERPGGLSELPVAEVLRQARLIFIRQKSSRFNKEKLERELLKRKEFGEMGLEITRSANSAELVFEITRKRFTTRFTCSIIEPATQRVVAGVTASSLGGEIEPHLADAIIKQFKAVRGKPAAEEKKPK